MKHNKHFSLALLLGISTLQLLGQKPSDFAGKFENEVAVRLSNFTEVEIEVDDEELAIVRRSYQKTYYVSPQLNGRSKVNLDYEPPFTRIADVDARVYIPDFEKDKYSSDRIKELDDRKILDDDVFHNGTRSKAFEFTGIRKGGMTELEYEEEIAEPRFIGREIFSSSILTLDQKLSLKFDEEIDLDIDYFNCDSSWFDIKRETKRGQKIITWQRKEIEPLKSESNQPPYLSLAPHIIYRIKSYQVDEKEKPMLKDVGQLYSWYYGFIADLDEDLSPELKGITDSIIEGKTNPRHKAEAIYNWVNNAVRYIAFEDGLGGFKPRPANLVCDRRYGDCKDMANIMVNMFRHAGLNAYHVWVGTRDIPYSYSRVPSVLADNHMIAALKLNDEYLFLDATNKALPFPYPSPFTQGKEALIGLGKQDFKIQKIPIVPSHLNLDYDSISLQLAGQDLKGTGVSKLAGYNAHRMNRMLEQKGQDVIKDLMKNAYRKGNNRCKANFVNYNRGDTMSVLHYTFEVPGFAYSMDEKLYLNLNLESIFDNLATDKDRVHPLSFERTYGIERKNVLDVPEGYVVTYLPEKAKKSFEGFAYELSYEELAGNRIQYHLIITIDRLEIGLKELPQWNEFIADLRKIYNQTIILEKA